jgi:hypothetical protein
VKRKKQNPIDDLAKNVGGWLGGAARTFADLTDSSRDNAPRAKGTQKFIEGSRMIGRTADALTGGFGSAALKDARKGSSVPSNLLKTAAVNLAAGGVAYGAAKGAQKTVAKVAPQLMQDVGVHFSTNKTIHSVIKSSPDLRGTGKGPSRKANFEINIDTAKGKTYKFAGYGPILGSSTKRGEMLPASKFEDFMSAQDTAYVTRSRLGRVDPENPALYKSPNIEDWYQRGGKFQSQRVTGRQRIIEVVPDYYDGKLSDAVTRARAQLDRDRQNVANVSGLVAGLAPKKSRGGGRNKK